MLNFEAVRKILKKHDKVMGSAVKDILLDKISVLSFVK